MKIIMAGGGKKIFYLAKAFISKGYDITVINDDREQCEELAKVLACDVVYGDASKPFILEDAGIERASLAIAMTRRDEDNLVVCQLAKKKYRVARTVAIVDNPKNVDLFKQLGIDSVISTAVIISNLIEQRASMDDVINLIPIEEGKAAIFEVDVHKDYPVCGRQISEIDVPHDSIISCMIREGDAVIPRGDTTIMERDRLIVLCLPEVQSKTLLALTGSAD